MVFCFSSPNELRQPECSSLIDQRLMGQYILINIYYLSIIILGSRHIGMNKTNKVPAFNKLTF